jgi:hypothetical protein
MSRYEDEQAQVRDAAASFPPTFGLRAFPGDVFRINAGASFVSEGAVQLVIDVQRTAQHDQWLSPDDSRDWLNFTRDTPAAIRRELRQVVTS